MRSAEMLFAARSGLCSAALLTCVHRGRSKMKANNTSESKNVIVAAVHAASVMLNAQATVAKACRLIEEAASGGARLVVFPESFIPGFPLWNALRAPIDGHAFFRRFADNSIQVPGAEVQAIAGSAARNRIFVSMGLSERSVTSPGCLWNSNILISEEGTLLNHHRKLVPTFYEKLSWTGGDAAGLKVAETPFGRVGSLICGENNNPLARYTLMAQGEQIHTGNYPPVWPFRNPLSGAKPYDLSDAIRLRSAMHSFEAKVFTVVSAGFLDEASLEIIADGDETGKQILRASPRSCSMVVGPTGDLCSEIRRDEEGIVFAKIDIGELVELKQHHDMAGYYNRLDIFSLAVNRSRRKLVSFDAEESGALLGADFQPMAGNFATDATSEKAV